MSISKSIIDSVPMQTLLISSYMPHIIVDFCLSVLEWTDYIYGGYFSKLKKILNHCVFKC